MQEISEDDLRETSFDGLMFPFLCNLSIDSLCYTLSLIYNILSPFSYVLPQWEFMIIRNHSSPFLDSWIYDCFDSLFLSYL